MHVMFFILLVAGTFAVSAIPVAAAESEPPSALAISIGGIGPGVDSRALARINQLIADGIKQNLFDRFIIHGRGREGGYSGCVQMNANAAPKKMLMLEKRLQAIKPDSTTTAYSVERTLVCDTLVNDSETE